MANVLKWVTQPNNATQGWTLTGTSIAGHTRVDTPLMVGLYDSTGTTLQTSDTTPVTISIQTNPTSGSVLNGTLTQTPVNGIASFPDCSITLGGNGYILQAAASGYTTQNSNSFNLASVIRHDAMVVQGTINGNGQYVGPYRFRGHTEDLRQNEQRISIRGTFSGTIAVIVVDPGVDQTQTANQVTIASYTTPTSQVFVAGGQCDIYFLSTAWSSGTATCSVFY